MSSLYLFAMLIGIGWLCVWSALPQPWTEGWWWPFDMRGDERGTAPVVEHGRRRSGTVPRRVRWRVGARDRQRP
jgi:hypothetical protein